MSPARLSIAQLFADLDDADPDLVEAVAQAKKTSPQFLDGASKIRYPPATFLVKVPFVDRSDTDEEALVRTADIVAEHPTRPICHLWLSATSVLDELVFRSVHEAPLELHLECGTSFVIASYSIEYYMIIHVGSLRRILLACHQEPSSKRRASEVRFSYGHPRVQKGHALTIGCT